MRFASMLTLLFLALGAAIIPLPAFAAGNDAAVAPFAAVAGEFRSMAGNADRGVLLLASASLLEVGFDGKTRSIPLPTVTGANPEAGMSDLVVRGSQAVFCRFVEPVLYLLDLEKPGEFKHLPITGLPEGRMEFSEIGLMGDGYALTNANGGCFLVDAHGAATRLPEKALPLADRAGKPVLLDAPKPMGEANAWTVSSADGKPLFSRSDPAKDQFLQALKPIGFGPDGRLFVLEVLGAGELKETRSVLAIRDGKVQAFRSIPSSDPGPLVRAHLIAPDGSTIYATDGGNGRLALHRLSIL